MNPTCATCKHWELWADVHDDYYGNYPAGAGWCRRFDQLSTPEPIERKTPTLALMVAESGGHAGLVTLPDFGCVQWDARECP